MKNARARRDADEHASRSPKPILNSPFEEPSEHWHIEEGEAAANAARAAGRPCTSTATRRRRTDAGRARARGQSAVELALVNLIRERVQDWRERGLRRASRARRWSCCSYWRRGRPRAAAVLRPARGGRDDHLPDRGPRRLPPGHRRPARRAERGAQGRGLRGLPPLRLQDGDGLAARRPSWGCSRPGASSTRSTTAATRASPTWCWSSARTSPSATGCGSSTRARARPASTARATWSRRT